MNLKFLLVSNVLKAWLIVLFVLIGLGLNSGILSAADSTKGGAAENWNFKSTSISPANPSPEDIITIQLEVNDDSNIVDVQIYICRDTICGAPVKMISTTDNIFTHKVEGGTFPDGTAVDYKFEINYDNMTEHQYIPKSLSTDKVREVEGTLYFGFYVGENPQYDSHSISPDEPSSSDKITFTLKVTDDTDISGVLIDIVKIEPTTASELPVSMEKSTDSANTFTYTYPNTFESGAIIGYRFIILYTDSENTDMIPSSKKTSGVIEVDLEGDLENYFELKIGGAPSSNGGSDGKKDDDGGFLPGFETITTVISLLVMLLVITKVSSSGVLKRRK